MQIKLSGKTQQEAFRLESSSGLSVVFLTIFGFAGAVVGLQEVALHTAAGVGAVSICARLTARPVHIALIEICGEITIH